MESDIGTRRLPRAQEDVREMIRHSRSRRAPGRKRAATALIAIGLALPLVVPGSALADRDTRRDSEDASGGLDVRVLSHSHSGRNILKHRMTTWEGWDARRLEGRSYIEFRFSTDRDEMFERFVRVNAKGRNVRARLYDYHGSGDSFGVAFLRRVKVRKPARNAIVVYLRRWRDLAVGKRQAYSWDTATLFRSDDSRRCSDRKCQDYSPSMEHDLGS